VTLHRSAEVERLGHDYFEVFCGLRCHVFGEESEAKSSVARISGREQRVDFALREREDL